MAYYYYKHKTKYYDLMVVNEEGECIFLKNKLDRDPIVSCTRMYMLVDKNQDFEKVENKNIIRVLMELFKRNDERTAKYKKLYRRSMLKPFLMKLDASVFAKIEWDFVDKNKNFYDLALYLLRSSEIAPKE